MKLGLVGCGLAGAKRAAGRGSHALLAVADPVLERARAVAVQHGGQAFADWEAVVGHPGVEAVIVATTHDQLATIARAAAEANKHVLVEKPGARTAAELAAVGEAARAAGVQVRVGYNHRFHPGLLQAREIARSGRLGELCYVRGRYGHGGRPGYDREWRADPRLSGGGELLDQGVHLVDLARWFLGELALEHGVVATYYWDMPVEDNAFVCLRGRGDRTAWLHASWTEWKNLFSFEVFGRTGKLEVAGLGGSYGPEQLVHYAMRPELGPPDATSWDYPGPDRSWELELAEFARACAGEPGGQGAGLEDGLAALRIVEAVYGGRSERA